MSSETSKSLAWCVQYFHGLSADIFARRHPYPVLIHADNPTTPAARPAWKTSVMAIPSGPPTASLQRFDPNSRVMFVEKTARNPYRERVYLGRAQANDIILEDPGISKSHAFFAKRDDGEWTLTDVGSSNGTTLRDHEIKPHDPIVLPAQVNILFGSSYLVVYMNAARFYALLVNHGLPSKATK